MGPYNKDTGTAWLTVVSRSHPTVNGVNLRQLGRLCACGTDITAIKSELGTRDLTFFHMTQWLREIVLLGWPGQLADVFYVMDHQAPREAYIAAWLPTPRVPMILRIIAHIPDDRQEVWVH